VEPRATKRFACQVCIFFFRGSCHVLIIG